MPKPPTARAVKQRRYRRRHAAHRAVLSVEVELFPVADLLVSEGFLEEWNSDSRNAIADALAEFVAVSSRYG